MAGPSKRQRAQEDSESEDSPPPSSSKRARGDSDEFSRNRRRLDTVDAMDYDFAAEELSTQRATKEIQRRMKEVKENLPADGGIITAVICENFMCHSFLEIKFGPFVNFVIGENGSGKSAILTAITLCLGGKASSTNRGSSLKTFVKEGTDTARIVVKLKNGGEGFKTDLYDDIIIIERNFTKEGTSGYKLKSKQGRTISSKKEELDEICDFYGLQVDNPMTVLTQDNARQFLSNSSSIEKYKFFARGVQLEQLDQDYGLIKQGITNTEAVIETRTADLVDLQANFDRWARKMDQVKDQGGLRQKIEDISFQMAWAQVAEAETALENINETVLEAQEKVKKAEEEREKSSVEFDAAALEVDEMSNKVKTEEEKVHPIEDELKQMKEKFQQNKQDLHGLQADERVMRSSLQGTIRKISEAKQNIKKEEDRLEALNGGSNTKLMEERKHHAEEAERLEVEFKALEEQIGGMNREASSSIADIKAIKTRIAAKQHDVENSKAHLQGLQQAEQDFMRAFDRKVPQLLEAIRNERGFRIKPVGPIGYYVTLRKDKWASILERFFGGTLAAFVVTNHADGDLLKRLMRQTGCDFPYHISTPQNLNRLEEPDPRFDTIHRIIEVNNEHVLRQLIVGNSIEQAILIEDLDEANQVMEQRSPNDRIGICFALNRERKGCGHKVGGRIGALGVSPIMAWNAASRMRTDIGAQKRNVESEIDSLKREIDGLDQEKCLKEQSLRQLQQSIQTSERRLRELKHQFHTHEDTVEQLRGRLEENSQDANIGGLVEGLRTYEEKKDGLERQYEDFIVGRDRLNSAQEELTARMKSINQDLALARRRVEDDQRELARLQRKREQCLSNKNHWYEKVDKYTADVVGYKEEQAKCETEVQTISTQANQVSARVEVPQGETTRNLEARLEKMIKELERAEALLGGTAEEITASFRKAHEDYKIAKTQISAFDRLLAAETRVYNERKRRWILFQRFISARARAQFTWMMSERAFKGRLGLLHHLNPPELKIEVQPGQEDTGNRGPKTLSGGEKSFSTICLLLSLWEAMGSPIRCLDEFDVFMDSVNRTISVKMMIKTAERSAGKQFIMITPLGVTENSLQNVKIIRMRNPERSNRMRNPEQSNRTQTRISLGN